MVVQGAGSNLETLTSPLVHYPFFINPQTVSDAESSRKPVPPNDSPSVREVGVMGV